MIMELLDILITTVKDTGAFTCIALKSLLGGNTNGGSSYH